jgi:hypothetical protein
MRVASPRSHASPGAQRAPRVLHVRKWVPVRRGQALPGGELRRPGAEGLKAPDGAAGAAAVVSLSPAAQRAVEDPRLFGAPRQDEAGGAPRASAAESSGAEGDHSSAPSGQGGLTADEEQVVRELAQRDRAVRAHEAAHQAAGGDMTGSAAFTTETGPDGRQYAVGGEVPIQMSEGRTPEETLQRAERIRAAALAPGDPSPQDRAVAAAAAQMEAQARAELAQRRSAAAASSRSSAAGAASGGETRSIAVARRALSAYRAAAA